MPWEYRVLSVWILCWGATSVLVLVLVSPSSDGGCSRQRLTGHPPDGALCYSGQKLWGWCQLLDSVIPRSPITRGWGMAGGPERQLWVLSACRVRDVGRGVEGSHGAAAGMESPPDAAVGRAP